ncbi:MAG: FG-GAP repeat domain-containing protein, partial [Gammaproteobacteria bacterium]
MGIRNRIATRRPAPARLTPRVAGVGGPAGTARPRFPKTALAGAMGRAVVFATLAAAPLPAWASTSQLVFTNPAVLPGLRVPANSYPALVDIDGDGKLDAFVGAKDGTIHFFRNIGTANRPLFQEQTGSANPLNGVSIGSYSVPVFVDIDGDGLLDAFIGANNGTIRFFRNTGSATNPVFVEQTGSNNPFNGVTVGSCCGGRSAPAFVDINGDGNYDAFIGDFDGTVDYFENTGTATSPVFTQRTGTANPLNGVDVGFTSAPTFYDVNGDGDYDALIGTKYGTVLYFENTGTASAPVFTPRTGAANPANQVHIRNNAAPVVADVNGDGIPDLVVGGQPGDVHVFPGVRTATGITFTDPNPMGVAYGISAAAAAFADIDGDGNFDALVGSYDGTVHYFQNTGTASAPEFVERTGTANPLNGVNVGGY